MKINIKTLLLSGLLGGLFGAFVQGAEHSKIDAIKEKWLTWADAKVATERDAFLANYGLNASCLDNAERLAQLKSESDKKVEYMLTEVPVEDKGDLRHIEPVKQVAASVFKDYASVEILHDPEFEVGDVCVFKHYNSNVVYVGLNCEKHLENLPQLKEVLGHECSHVVYEDSINQDLMQCTAWVNSSAERVDIEQQTLPYHRMLETRADVYAALNSPFHGKYLIDFLKRGLDDEPITHPKQSDRVALLEQIKLELDSAKDA